MTGIALGLFDNDEIIIYPGEKHLLTVAPNGSGKDVSCVNIAAITHKSSLICVDPKGTTAKKTARWRAEVLKQGVHVFDPYHIVPDHALPRDANGNPMRAGFSPIKAIAKDKHPVSKAKIIAGAMVVPDEKNRHWGDGARSHWAAHMMFAALDQDMPDDYRNMAAIWEALVLDDEPEIKTEYVKKKPVDVVGPSLAERLRRRMINSTVGQGYVSRETRAHMRGAHDEMRGIVSSIRTNCGSILDDPEIIDNMSESTVDFDDIQRKPTTIYIVLPGDLAETHSRWVRLLLTCILSSIERSGVREHDSPHGRTLWLLNEFATMKRNDVLLEALPRMREYGCQFWIFVQDLSQLRYHYKEAWETFISACGVIQTFGGSPDNFTAEYLSKMTGRMTQDTYSTGINTKVGSGQNLTTGMTSRPLYYPDDIMRLNSTPETAERQLLILSGMGVVEADRLLYYKDHPGYMKWATTRGLA